MVNIWKEMKDVERKKESLKMSQHKKNENTRQRPLDPVKMENEAESVKDKETGSTSRLSNIRESDETDSSASSATSVTSEIASMFVEEILDQAMGNINELMQSISRWEAEEQPKSEADDKSSAACCSRQLQRFFSLRRVFAEHQGQTQEVTQEDMVSKMFSTPGTVAEAVTPKGVMEIIKKDKLVTAVDSSQDDEDVCKSSPAVSTQTSSDSERTDEKSSDRHGSKMYKKIKSVLRRSFRWRQKKKDHLEEKQDLDEASGSDSSDKEAGSPCPEETSPTDSMRSGEDLRDATKADLSSAPLERLGVDEEDVMPEKKPSKPSSKLSTTSSSPPAEHRKERSPVTEKDLYRDSTPGTVADKDVTPKGVMESFIEDNLVTEMDAKSKDIHLVRPGTPFLREMSFIKMDSPSQEDDKDVCKSSPTVSTQGPCDSDRTEEKSADRHGSKMYKKIKSIWKHSFRWRQKKTDHLEEQDSDEAGGSDSSDSSDMKPGSPRPEEKSPTGSMCSSEDIRDATKSDLYSVTLERVDEDVAPEEKPSKLSSKPSITSSSPPAEHHTEKSSVTDKDLYRDSTPGTVADKDVTPKGLTQSFIEDNLVTEMDAKSKDIHLVTPGSPILREMSFTKMDSPSQEDDKDVCKSSPTVSTQGPCDSERTEEKSADRHGSKMYKKIKSIWKHSFRSRQKKTDHLEEQDSDEAGGSDSSDSSDRKPGSPRPEEKSPTGSVCSSEDIRDATKADLYSVPLEMVDVEDEDVAPEEKPSKPSSKPSTTSSSPPSEHHTEWSSVTEKDLYRDSTPETVADKDVIPEGVTQSFIEDNLVTEMDAKSKDIHLARLGSPFRREMSFTKMDSPSQEEDKDGCKSSPTVSTQGPCDSDRTEEKSSDRHGSKMYKKIKSIWKHSFRWRQKKMNHLETDPDLDETGGSDSNDLKSGSPRPEEKSPTGSVCSSEDIRDATKADLYSVPLEMVDVEDEDVAPEEKPSKLSSKPSITSSSPPAEHHTEKSSVTDKDLYRDSTPGTVADKEVTHEGVTKSFIEDNLVTEMDAKSKDIHLVTPGSPFLREMSFIKMDSPSQEDDKDVCKSSPTVSTQGPCDSDRTEEKSADRHGSKMYKKIKSIWKHSFRWRQKKMNHLETDPDLDETGGSDSNDLKSGSPRPEEKSPTGSMCSSEDIRDATKSDQRSVPLEEVDKVDEDVAPEEKPSKLSSKPSITSSSPPAEHHTEKSSVTDKDLYRDSTPGTVADKEVTHEGVTKSFIEDNLVTEMDAKSKDIHLVRPGSPFLREMSFIKMDSPSQDDDKDVCKSSPTVSTQGPCDSDRTEEKSADRHGSKMYKKIMSIWKHSFRWRQKKTDHLEEQDSVEAGGSDSSDSSDRKPGSPRPEEKSPTGSMCSSEDIRDATKADLYSVPLELVDVEDEDVAPEEKPSKPSSKPSTTSSSPPSEHHTEWSSVTEKDLYRDSTPGTVADKDVTPEGVTQSFIEDNLVTEMDAKSKDIHLARPGSPFLREMSFTKMDSPSQEKEKDVCKSSPTVSTQGPCDSDRTEEKSADRHGSKMYKKIMSIWKHSFRWRQKKTDHLEEQDSVEAGGSDSSDSSDRKPGSPRPEEKSPTGSMCSSEDIRDATKADLYSVPLELVDVEDEDVAPEEKPSKPSSKPSTTSSSPPSEHHTEWSSVTEKDLYRDSTPGTVADKDVTPEGVTQSFIEDNLVTEMDAKSKDIHLARPGSPFLREMSFTKMDSPSQEKEKDVCKSSPTVSTQGPCDSDRTEEKSADRHGSKMYKKIKSIWKHSFRSRQKKMDHLETDPDLDEAGGSDNSDLKSGSPRPEEKSPTGSMYSSEDIRDATKSDLRSGPLEGVDVEDDDVTPEEKPSKPSSKPSTTSSSPPAEHHTERSSVTEKDINRDSTPGTVANKDVTPKGFMESINDNNLVTEMDATSKDTHLTKPGSRFPDDTSPTALMCCREDIRDTTKADLSSVPLELVDVEDEDITQVDHGEERSSDTKPSTTSSETEKDLYKDYFKGSQGDSSAAAEAQLTGLKNTLYTIIKGFFDNFTERQRSEMSNGVYNMDVKKKLVDFGTEVIRLIIEAITNMLSKPIDEFPPPYNMTKRGSAFSPVCGTETVGQNLPLQHFWENVTGQDNIQQSLKGSFGEAFTLAIVKSITDEVNPVLSETIQASLAGGTSNVHAATCCQFSTCGACKEMLAGVTQVMNSFLTGLGTASKKTIQTERTQKHSGHETKDDRVASAHHKKVHMKKSPCWSFGRKWRKNKVQPEAHLEEEVTDYRDSPLLFEMQNKDKKALSQDQAVQAKRPSLLKRFQLFYAPSMKM
ncbi:microtubule-associated protein 1B-like isoform X2 [Micropterus dolomieu]|uniref:microtubule-associated protein 1B-like isoform X2 n=1 Tax=Micropterus dolomieu TaxID=147949 RepID=UPI001E8D1ABE|nr:microtubule-associated protein 1B-like isoform X2 [Micropterus dolomieu]